MLTKSKLRNRNAGYLLGTRMVSPMPGSSGGGGAYPSVSGSLLWIDYNNACTDASGLVPATAGQAVQTITLPTGWGASLGDGLARQTTSGNRPTWQADGLQGDGATKFMSLPATVSIAGKYTVWSVFASLSVPAEGVLMMPLSMSTSGAEAPMDVIRNESQGAGKYIIRSYPITNSNTYLAQYNQTTNFVLARTRRDASNLTYAAGAGLADVEITGGSQAGVFNLNQILRRSTTTYIPSTTRVKAIILVGDDAVTAGTSATVEAAIQSLYGVSLT